MIRLKIWERYFLSELTKVFVLFLISFYGIYALVDYSNHSRSFANYHFSYIDIISYYGYEFITRMDTLIPFALLIACIKTVCSLNVHNELIALMISGIRMRRLLAPFIAFGLLFTAFLYFNTEVLQPQALKYRQHITHLRAKEKHKKNHHPHIQHIVLPNNTSLIFKNYDAVSQQFFDAYWIKTPDDFYRIHTLSLDAQYPLGTNVQHFLRNPNGILLIADQMQHIEFPEITIDKQLLNKANTQPDGLSLTALFESLPNSNEELSEKEARILTTYYYKLAMPWLCFLAILGPIPLCISFSRTLSQFFIYVLSIFGLVSFYLVMDAAVILGERQAISPEKAIWIPFGSFFVFFFWRFLKKTNI